MRPIAYFFAVLLVIIVAVVVFALSVLFLPKPIDSIYEYLLLIGVVVVAVIGGLATFNTIVEMMNNLITGFRNRGSESSRRWSRKLYLQHLYFRHRNFDVKGLSTQGSITLELEQVFVELSLAPRSLRELSKDPLQLPQALQTGRHTIWEFLQADAASKQNFVVIGPPGCGKTTLLKHMALMFLDEKDNRSHNAIPDKLPILLFLRNHIAGIAAETEAEPYTLTDAIQQDLHKWERIAPAGWFHNQLDKGDCLVMLDGLDEVADQSNRQAVVAWVDRQMIAFPHCQFVITSRPHGYLGNRLTDVSVLEVRPFNLTQQTLFVNNWYLANEIKSQAQDDEGVRMDAKEGAVDLLNRLRSTPKLTDLAVNPLLLTMIATVHRYRSSLPERRVELYAEICEVFLGKRKQSKGLTLDMTPAQRQYVLQPLAWHMMTHEIREIKADKAQWVIKPFLKEVNRTVEALDFLQSIENESGLLLEQENGSYAFAHLTFQEYMAAVYAKEQQLGADLIQQVNNGWWYETILLYAARADATPIIEACLGESDLPDIEALLLAVAAAEEALVVAPQTQQRLDNLLDEAAESEDKARAHLIAWLCLRQRVNKMVYVSETKAMDTSLVTHAEYQLFLDEKRAQGEYFQPDHWYQNQFSKGQGNEPVLGVRSSDAVAFCVWLTEKLAGDIVVRIPRGEEITAVHLNPYEEQKCIGYWAQMATRVECESVGQLPSISHSTVNDYLALDLNLDFDLARDRALGLARVLDLALNLDLARARAHAHTIDLDLARDLDRARAPARALDFELDQAIVRARARARALDISLDLTQDRALALDLARAYYFSSYWVIKVLALDQDDNVSWRTHRDNRYQQWRDEMDAIADDYLHVFVDLCVLEERIKGKLPAFEGILLVKELVD